MALVECTGIGLWQIIELIVDILVEKKKRKGGRETTKNRETETDKKKEGERKS
jgi:hypothetical protein